MMEEWRNIDGYEGLYQISDNGRVKSLGRLDSLGHLRKERIRKPAKDKDGYLYVSLCKNGRGKTHRVHRLVAEAFLDNPDNLPIINHRDECKTNNHVDNLEWCTCQYNLTYGSRIEQMVDKTSKKVQQYSLDGEFIAEFPSTMEVQRQLGYSHSHISKCCLGKIKTAYGYKWAY